MFKHLLAGMAVAIRGLVWWVIVICTSPLWVWFWAASRLVELGREAEEEAECERQGWGKVGKIS